MKFLKLYFNLMVIGQIISIFGAAILRFALSLYVLDITGRADMFATLFAVSSIPGIVLAPVGGAIADRFNRRNLMVIFDFSSSATILVFGILLLNGVTSILIIGVVIAVLSLISAMYQPSVTASIPLLVHDEHLAKANGIVNGVGALSNLAGPVLGGVMYALFGLNTIVIYACIAFFLSAVMEIFIKIPFTKREKDKHIIPTIINDMKKGFFYLLRENTYILRTIILAAALNLCLTPFFVIGAPYVLRVTMGSSDVMYGAAMGVVNLSSILGALTIGFFSRRLKMERLYRWLFLIGLLIVAMSGSLLPFMLRLGYWPSFLLFVGCAIPIVMAVTIVSIFVVTMVQKGTPNELLGKVMAIIVTVTQSAAPIGQILCGGLFETFSTRVYIPVLIAAVLTFAMTFAAKAMLRRRDGEPAAVTDYTQQT